jgi:hypothetical protein
MTGLIARAASPKGRGRFDPVERWREAPELVADADHEHVDIGLAQDLP